MLAQPGVLDALAPIERISPAGDGSHYFYGYYDNYAFSADNRRHLCHRTAFMDRLPAPQDSCELGVIDLATRQFDVLSATRAWNFQQGALLEWNPANGDEVLYNAWQDGSYICTAQDTRSGTRRVLGPAVADVSPDGKYGLAVNFNRIYDFRPGYGYCQQRDPWYDIAMPEDDGVTLLDLHSGTSRLLFTYRQLGAIFNTDADLRNAKIVINHITFNRTSDRFLFLLRNFPQPGRGWLTALGTADLAGRVFKLSGYTYASHYYWKDDRKLLIYADCGAGRGLYELTDQTRQYYLYDRSFFNQDVHCSYSPDQRYIIGDGYPDRERYRGIYLYNIAEQRGLLLGRFYSPPPANTDIRCDLHTRWSRDGRTISFDSIHEGYRGVYTMDLGGVLDKLI
ncbi:MAG: TolB-like translocation protein [Anaerolineae bacterium]